MVKTAGKNGRTRRTGGRTRSGRGCADGAALKTERTTPAEETASGSGVPVLQEAACAQAEASASSGVPEKEEPVSEVRPEGEGGQVRSDEARNLPPAGETVPDEPAAEEAAQSPEKTVEPEPAPEEHVPGELDMLRGELFSEDLEQNAVEQMFRWAKREDGGMPEGGESELSGAALLEAVHHGRHVAELALSLFEALSGRLGLDMHWARVLAQAALWHDLGFAVGGRRRHHKRSMEIIEGNGCLSLSFGLEESDRALTALLARYHRRAWPSMKHRRFAALNKEERRALSAAASLLRIADALDYRHKGAVEEVRVGLRRHAVRMVCFGTEPCGRECRRALKKGDLFESLYGGRLEVVPGKEGDRDAR